MVQQLAQNFTLNYRAVKLLSFSKTPLTVSKFKRLLC